MDSPQRIAGMACPVCRSALHMTERKGVEIDYCPGCRGVWLDRGELDKIIERSVAEEAPVVAAAAAPAYRDDRYERRDERHYKPKRRKSFLEELFD